MSSNPPSPATTPACICISGRDDYSPFHSSGCPRYVAPASDAPAPPREWEVCRSCGLSVEPVPVGGYRCITAGCQWQRFPAMPAWAHGPAPITPGIPASPAQEATPPRLSKEWCLAAAEREGAGVEVGAGGMDDPAWLLTRARSALECYGRHHPWCDYLRPVALTCSCGLERAIRDATPAAPTPEATAPEPTRRQIAEGLFVEQEFRTGPDDGQRTPNRWCAPEAIGADALWEVAQEVCDSELPWHDDTSALVSKPALERLAAELRRVALSPADSPLRWYGCEHRIDNEFCPDCAAEATGAPEPLTAEQQAEALRVAKANGFLHYIAPWAATVAALTAERGQEQPQNAGGKTTNPFASLTGSTTRTGTQGGRP